MWSKFRFWLTNFADGLVAIISCSVLGLLAILARVTDMVVPNNRLYRFAEEIAKEATPMILDDLQEEERD